MTSSSPSGILNIHKPVGPTSHDVVARVRRAIRMKKIGHAGTLDPLASGILVLCVGSATRLSDYAMRSTKQYQANVRLGVETDTYDAEGEIIAECPTDSLTCDQVEAALAPFRGDIAQIPPMYSAIKKGGKKLYELARQGVEVDRPPRDVTIAELEMTRCDLPDLILNVTCSPGTYIRSLAHDLGAALGVGAHLTGLVRVASGGFNLDNAVHLADFEAAALGDQWQQFLLPPEIAVADLPMVILTPEHEEIMRNGGKVYLPDALDGELRVHIADGQMLALVHAQDGWLRPHKVFQT